MRNFLEGMSTMEQTYWIVALIGTVAFLIIFLLTFIGGDADMDTDISDFEADDGGVGYQFFTLKNLTAFLTIFGWTGLVCIKNQCGAGTTLFVSILAGLIMMVLTSYMFYWISKLSESGSLVMKNAIGNIGEVYIPLKANRGNIGKVQIKVQGRLHELDASTDGTEDLPTGTVVKVESIVGEGLLIVVKN